ncbi:hypothetical protein BDR22DRAFT_670235 [Usnea florida]
MSLPAHNSTNDYLSQSRGGEIIGASIPLLILPTVAVALRLLSRWVSRAGFWWDDYTIVLACFLCWGPNIVNLVSLHYGAGRHNQALLLFFEKGLVHLFKALYCSELLWALATASVKYSILLFIYRIFPVVQLRRILLWFTCYVVCVTISCIFVSVFQCIPVHTFWDTFAGQLKGGKCINVQLYFLITGIINAATDFALLATPIPVLWRLKTSKLQKLVLTGIFTIGLCACAVSVIRLVMLEVYGNRSDYAWNYVSFAIWSAADPAVTVVSACLPSLRPLFVHISRARTHRSHLPPTSRHGGPSLRKSYGDGSFNRLQERSLPSGHADSPWTNHDVAVYGGRQPGDAASDEIELGGGGGEDETRFETPVNRIRAKTTVVLTISDRVDYQDDLF